MLCILYAENSAHTRDKKYLIVFRESINEFLIETCPTKNTHVLNIKSDEIISRVIIKTK